VVRGLIFETKKPRKSAAFNFVIPGSSLRDAPE